MSTEGSLVCSIKKEESRPSPPARGVLISLPYSGGGGGGGSSSSSSCGSGSVSRCPVTQAAEQVSACLHYNDAVVVFSQCLCFLFPCACALQNKVLARKYDQARYDAHRARVRFHLVYAMHLQFNEETPKQNRQGRSRHLGGNAACLNISCVGLFCHNPAVAAWILTKCGGWGVVLMVYGSVSCAHSRQTGVSPES